MGPALVPTARTWGAATLVRWCRPGLAGPGGGTAAAAPAEAGFRPGSGARAPPSQLRLGPGPVWGLRVAWGGLGGEALAEPFLALGEGSPGTRNQTQKGDLHLPPPGPQNSWFSQLCLPQPHLSHLQLFWTHALLPFPIGVMGAPILETRKLEDHKPRRTKRSKPSLQLSPFPVQRPERALKGQKNRGQKKWTPEVPLS